MAEIFKARSTGSAGFARDVVIKRILPAYGHDPEFVQMFVDEARILGALHHPNVVQAYDFCEEDGALFLALEYVDGPSLSRVLRTLRGSGQRMSPAIVSYVAREICRALDYVHTLTDADGRPLDIVHRDVTPSNVMLTPAGAVKLLDFGVARHTTGARLTKAGTVKGKPAYLAPEQVEGKPIDGRVDLFAVGIVMHEMLTLEHLFAGDSELGTVRRLMEMEVPAPSQRRPDVSPELDRVVMRALERDRDRRYPNAAAMARDLDDLVIASKLRVEEVVAFVRAVDAQAAALVQRPPAPAARTTAITRPERPTRRDPALAARRWAGEHFPRGSRGTIVAAVVLAALSLATALGLRAGSPSAPRVLTRAAEVTCVPDDKPRSPDSVPSLPR
jgi:serine/threonine-protein kinase